MKFRFRLAGLLVSLLLLQACDNNSSNAAPVVPQLADQLMAGAASRSMLPTVNGGRDYPASIICRTPMIWRAMPLQKTFLRMESNWRTTSNVWSRCTAPRTLPR